MAVKGVNNRWIGNKEYTETRIFSLINIQHYKHTTKSSLHRPLQH